MDEAFEREIRRIVREEVREMEVHKSTLARIKTGQLARALGLEYDNITEEECLAYLARVAEKLRTGSTSSDA